MPGMPDDASIGAFFNDVSNRINNMTVADQVELLEEIGNTPGRNRMASDYMLAKDWFDSPDPSNPNAAMAHVQNHWLDNRPGSGGGGGKKIGWWRHDFSNRSNRDDMVDRVLTQALYWTVFLRRNTMNADHTFTEIEDPINYLPTVRMWMCAGHEFKIMIWQTEVQIIVIYMTPASPDKIKNYLRYRREHEKHLEVDKQRKIYEELERDVKTYPEPEMPTGGTAEPFILVTDEIPGAIPQGLEHHKFEGDHKVVRNVLSYRPFARADELENPFRFPPALP